MSEPYTGAPLPPGFYNMDCMKGMKGFPDKFFDLAIVDPPYGDGNASGGGTIASGDCSVNTSMEPIRAAIRPVQTDRSPISRGGGMGRTATTWA